MHQPKDIILQKERTKPVKNLEELGEYGKKLYDSILRHKEQDDFLLTVGGDHSIGSTTISALLNHYSSNLSVI